MAKRCMPNAMLLAFMLLVSFVSFQPQQVSAAQATHLSLTAPSSIHLGDEWSATAVLTDSSGNPVGGVWVTWYLDGQNQGSGITSADGSALFGVGGWQPPLGANSVSVSFNGTSNYLPSNASAVIDVLPESPTTYTTTTGVVKTGPVVELSSSDGSTVCPTYFRGNASAGVWDQGTLTCTLAGGGNLFPTFCVSASPGGCTMSAIGKLVIDKNVTVLADNGGSIVVYSEMDNYGTLISDITNYGVIQNHGTIDFNETNQLLNLSANGLGLINNTRGATLNNWYYITNEGIIDNYGTINNYGQFIPQLCSPCVVGTLANYGTYVGSLPAPVVTSSVNLYGGNGTADQNSTAGVTVKLTGATGDNVKVSTQVQGSQAPLGLGSVTLSSISYYDILITGTTTGTAQVCIANEFVNSTFGEIMYWNGSSWIGAANRTISGSPPSMTVCGDIPVSALVGTPLAVGTPSTTSGTTTSTTRMTTESTTSTPRGPSTTTGLRTGQGTSGNTTSSTSGPSAPSASWVENLALVLAFVVVVAVSAVALLRTRLTRHT